MRKLYFSLVIILITVLNFSCVDVVEHYDFKADGTCKVVYDFDMSKAVSVLMNLMSDSVAATPEFSMRKDTMLNFYSALPDSLQQHMSADEVKLAKGSNLAIKMDLKQSLMKASIVHEAKDVAELEYYLQHMSNIASNSQLTKAVKGGQENGKFNLQQLITGQDYYVYQVTPHRFYRIIDIAKFQKFLKKTQSTLAMAKAMLIDMPYKVVLNFAKPVKKINNSKAMVSANRKQVVLETNMDEIIRNPSIMNLKIDFE
ncbi:hypothetical protein GCM10027037_09720 [Mucilaginibacter koreensis]